MMFGAFIGGWELLLILIVLGGMVVAAPLAVFAIIYLLRREKRGNAETTAAHPERGQ